MMIEMIDGEQYARLLKRAREHHIRVIGFEVHEGYCVFRVTSSSDPEGHEGYYAVRCPDGEPLSLSCNCLANWVYGRACSHIAVAVEMLMQAAAEA